LVHDVIEPFRARVQGAVFMMHGAEGQRLVGPNRRIDVLQFEFNVVD
jgi:hypothetical protein